MILYRTLLTSGDYSVRIEYVRKEDMFVFHVLHNGKEEERVRLHVDRLHYRDPERVQRMIDSYAERYLNKLTDGG